MPTKNPGQDLSRIVVRGGPGPGTEPGTEPVLRGQFLIAMAAAISGLLPICPFVRLGSGFFPSDSAGMSLLSWRPVRSHAANAGRLTGRTALTRTYMDARGRTGSQ